MKLREYLNSKKACNEAMEWLADRTPEEVVNDCPRGDWLMWIVKELEINERKIILTNGHIANTVRDLMDDKRGRDMADMAIKYGEGKATKEEFDAASSSAADAASAAYYASTFFAVSYASDASYAAAFTAAYAACNADAAYSSASAAKTSNLLETADIARKFLGAEIIEKLNNKLK